MNMIKMLLLAACLLCLCDARSESRDGYSGSRGSSGDSRVTRSDHSGSRSGSSSGKGGSSKKSKDSKRRSSSSRKASRKSNGGSQKGSGSRDGASYGSGGSGGSNARGEHAPAPEKDQVCCLKDGAPSSVSCGAGGTSYCDSDYCVLVDGDQCPTSAPTEQPTTEQPTTEPTVEPSTTMQPTVDPTQQCPPFGGVVMWTQDLELMPGSGQFICNLFGGKCSTDQEWFSMDCGCGCATNSGACCKETSADVRNFNEACVFNNESVCLQEDHCDWHPDCLATSDSEASQLSVGGVPVARWVSPFEMAMEDQNLVYLVAAAAMATLAVVFYGCSRKDANKGTVYEELV